VIAPARREALRALGDVDAGRALLPDAVARLRQRLADPRDAALASELLIGTLRWRLTLDHRLAASCARPLEQLDAVVLAILRLGAYQLLHLERVPARAVVNDAVQLARSAGHTRATGLVNAVLRRLANTQTRPPLLARPGPAATRAEWISYLSVTHAHPEWLVRRWFDRLGPRATESRLVHGQTPAPMTLRPVIARTTAEALRQRLRPDGIEAEPAPYAPGAITVQKGHPLRTTAAEQGLFIVQDEGSQLVAAFASAAPGTRVLDVCASPGGKTTQLAEAVGPEGLVVAGDVRRRRLALLRTTVERAGAANVSIVGHDGRAGLPFGPVFDLVVVDAPCSGLGTLRREPDLKWRRREGDLASLAQAQRQLLDEASRCVGPGGRLVYATCSSEPEENDAVALWFEANRPEFARARPGGCWQADPLSSLVDARGWLRTVPERDGLDAYFAAMFRRRVEPVRAV
jgi:16S rRNA (cytosine967-C5)-methyltransferase